MALLATNNSASEAYRLIKQNASQLKINVQAISNRISAGNVDYEYLRDTYNTLTRSKDQLALLRATQGIVTYARDQEEDQTYAVKEEINTVTSAIGDTLTWMRTNVPRNVRVLPLNEWDDLSKSLIVEELTSVELAGLVSELNKIIAAIS
jgi:hypothetical protein